MKFMVWGAGIRGLRMISLLGKNRILAFVDSDTSKEGTLFEGIKIVSPSEAINNYHEAFYVITPEKAAGDIRDFLESHGIYTVFFALDLPMGIACADEYQKPFEMYRLEISHDKYQIKEFSLISILFAEYLRELKKDVCFIKDCSIGEENYKLLSDQYALYDEEQSDAFIVDHVEELIRENLGSYNPEFVKLKGIHKNQRCFIVATGPSLTVEDLNILDKNNDYCIGMNRIYEIFDRTDWRPDYYVIEDPYMIEDLADDIAGLEIKNKFISSQARNYWDRDDVDLNQRFRMVVEDFGEEGPHFSEKIDECMYCGRTVTYVCLQLACYLGFHEIYLLGVDFHYSKNIEDRNNHFEGYNGCKKIRLNPIAADKNILAYQTAKKYADEHGIKIYNATRGGKLEVFERVDFDDIFKVN